MNNPLRLFLTPAILIIMFTINSSLELTAQNGGSSQVEFTSFEPTGGQEMVNPFTGDFSYTSNLLHVPGPGGGYSLSLFYHGGRKVDEVSSWVGLGWNVNAGAINRIPYGHPDDVKSRPSIGYSYNLLVQNAKTQGIRVGIPTQFITATAGVNWGTHQSTSYTAGLGVFGTGVEGTFSSNGASLRPNGLTAITGGAHTGQSGYIHSAINSQTAYPLLLATYVEADLSYYASSDRVDLTYGSLYTKDAYFTGSTVPGINRQVQDIDGRSYVMDRYLNPYSEKTYSDPIQFERGNNLSFPAYDKFVVSAQGIGGVFSANIHDHGTLSSTSGELAPVPDYRRISYYNTSPVPTTEDEIHFRFEGEPTSYAITSPGDWDLPSSVVSSDANYQRVELDYNDINTINSSSLNNDTRNKMHSAHPIEWFSNEDILNGSSTELKDRGFLEYHSFAAYGGRTNTDFFKPNEIGAFTITNAGGMSYHYSLPVYQYETLNMSQKGTDDYFLSFDKEKYAVSWLLTGITGADFIDKGTLGEIDDADEGYWVKFDYGLWSNGYIWKTPTQKDPISGYDVYSVGRKQVYYLDEIETKTHRAYFIKDVRDDALGETTYSSGYVLAAAEKRDIHNSYPDPLPCNGNSYDDWRVSLEQFYSFGMPFDGNGAPLEHKLLQLKKIIITPKNSSVPSLSKDASTTDIAEFGNGLTNGGGAINVINNYQNYEYLDALGNWQGIACSSPTDDHLNTNHPYFSAFHHPIQYLTIHNVDYVLDVNDLATNPNLEANALQVIEFETDYSLANGSPNANTGRLTLKKVIFKGRKGTSILPAYEFDYYNYAGYDATSADEWGYYAGAGTANLPSASKDELPKTQVDNWNLKSIHLLEGGLVEIKYEPDTYRKEVVFGTQGSTINVESMTRVNNTTLEVTVDNSVDLSTWFQLNSYYDLELVEGAFDVTSCTDPIAEVAIHGNFELILLDNTNKKLRFDIPISGLGTSCNNINDLSLWIFNTPDYFYGGKIRSNTFSGELIGGGLRVSEVVTDDGAGHRYATHYDYDNPNDSRTSGITSYAPRRDQQRFIPYASEIPGPSVMYEYVTSEQISDEGKSEGKTRIRFEALGEGNGIHDKEFQLGSHFQVEDLTGDKSVDYFAEVHTPTNRIDSIYVRSAVIHNRLAQVGRINSVENIDANGVTISSTTYEYFDDPPSDLGVLQESFSEVKGLEVGTVLNTHWFFTTSSKKTYPNILKSIKNSTGNIEKTTHLTNHDLYTGQPLTTYTENGYGEKQKSETTFLHTLTGYENMGSKVEDVTNHNLLTPQAYTKLSTSNSSLGFENITDWKPLSASAGTWTDQWRYREWDGSDYTLGAVDNTNPIWRPYRSFAWKGFLNPDGTLDNTFADFDFATSATNPGWEQVSEVTLYDRNSHSLEAKDINDKKAATILGYGDYQRTIASAANAKQGEFIYSGVEHEVSNNILDGGIRINTGTQIYDSEASGNSSANVHTGRYSAQSFWIGSVLSYQGTIGTNVDDAFEPGRAYRISAWVSSTALAPLVELKDVNGSVIAQINTFGQSPVQQAGNWYLVNLTVDLNDYPSATEMECSIHSASFSGQRFVDDFRVHPLDAPMQSFVYDHHTGEVIATLNEENIATKFVYDAAGRVIETWQETEDGFRLVSKRTYNYARPLD